MARCCLLLVVLGACGQVGSSVDAAIGSVTVQVWVDDWLNNGLAPPSVGTDVVVGHPDGSVVLVAQTDASGRATLEVTAGDMVTAFMRTNAGDPHLSTIVDVKPGDFLVMDYPGFATPATVGTLTVNAPPAFAGADFYMYNVGCEANSIAAAGTRSATITELCDTAPQAATAVVTAHQGTPLNSTIVAYNHLKNVSLAGGTGTAAFSDWRTDVATTTIDLVNAPAGTNIETAFVRPFVDSTGFSDYVLQRPAAPGSTERYVFGLPNGIFTSAYVIAAASFAGGGGSEITRGYATVPTSVSFDLAADLLPRISGAAATSTGVSFTPDSSLTAADGAVVTVRYTNPGDTVQWTFYLPATRVEAAFPALPSDLAAYAPSAALTPETLSVVVYGGETPAGWDATRNELFTGDDPQSRPGAFTLRSSTFVAPAGKAPRLPRR